MTVKVCYERIGANYEELVGRLGSEAMADRFAQKFLKDNSYTMLITALEEEKWEDAFRAVHTLKGVAANLSITPVFYAASALTEELRGGNKLVHAELLESLDRSYRETVKYLKECD